MESTPVDFDPFRVGEIARTAPSTEPQREIITSACLGEQANTAFNEAVSLRVSGTIDPARIENALRTIVERHDALRMTFTRLGNELCVANQSSFALERLDLTAHEVSAQEERIQALWRELVGAPMNLFEGPLFRAIWIQLADGVGELVLLAHHVVCDGWSIHVILEELSQLCSGTKPEDLAEAASFADFAERQSARAVSNADVDYWAKRFEPKPPVLDLPTDRTRPAFRTFAAERVDYTLDADVAKAIGAAAGKLKASVVNVALAGTAALLHRLTGESDLAIGLPVARQGAEGLAGLVGHAVQLLPIRFRVEAGMSFQELVGQAKSAVLDAREHFDFTFGTLIRDLGLSGNPSRVPLVPVIFNIDQPFGELTLGAASATLRSVPRSAENFEIFLNIVPSQNQLAIEATFNKDLFSADTMRCWLIALESLLADGTASPAKAISALRLSSKYPEIYSQLNRTGKIEHSRTWLDRMVESVSAQPDAGAVTDGKSALTYAELSGRATELAQSLVRRGVTQGAVVGLYMNRSCDLLVALVAVHKAGAAYLPLDPSFPESRLAFMLSDSGARLVITDVELPAALAGLQVQTLEVPQSTAGDKPHVRLPDIGAEDLAYLIYTSGSTGSPKGVDVTHGALANLLESMAARPGLGRGDTLLAVTTLSFDISALELLLPLTRGGRLAIVTRDDAADARKLAELLSMRGATVMQATPSTWRMLLNDGWPGSPALTALCGGEPLPADLAAALLGRVKALWNMYGPTETTIWSTCEQITSRTDPITIGRPIDNTVVCVMDEHGQPLPAGIPGEIWIGGTGVARGYHARPDLTAERFVEHPRFGRMYRTGDRGRVLASAVVEHLGRLDDQIKVRGFRIELAEIEVALAEHPSVRQAAVHLWTAKADDVRIVACCVPAKGAVLASISLRKHLRARLPEYMVPQHFLAVDVLPLTPNGKVDRRRLPAPVVSESRVGQVEAPADPVEAAIAEIWTALIHPARPVGRTDRFFEMGGHSLLGLEALQRIDEKLGVRLDPRVLFRECLADIATRCRSTRNLEQSERGVPARPVALAADAEVLLSENQERIYRAWQADPTGLQFHVPFSLKLTGAIDVQAFAEGLRALFARHTALRTVISQGGSGPVQKVMPVAQMCVLETGDVTRTADPDSSAVRLMMAQTEQPFDLGAGPVVRMMLIKLGDRAHHFFFMPHQIVFDGWSFDVVLNELGQSYALLEAGRTPELKAPALSYGDLTTWERRHARSAQEPRLLTFWRESLQDLPSPISWPGGSDDDARVGRVRFVIPRDAMVRYEAFCDAQNIRPQNLVLTAFAHVLGAALGRADLLIGLATSGRYVPEAARMVGLFFTYLPIRLRLPSGNRATDMLGYVQSTVQGVTNNRDIFLDQLAQLSASSGRHGSLKLQVAFSYQDARNRVPSIGSLRVDQVSISRPDLESDMEFWVRNTPTGLIASLDYRAHIAPRAVMESLRDDLLQVLERLTESPTAPVESAVRARLLHPRGVPNGPLGLHGASAVTRQLKDSAN